MSIKTLKWIAIITMTMDHIGYYLLLPYSPLYYIFRGFGRIAFPLFAFFIAEGFIHTRSLKKYFLRLLVFALMIEIAMVGFYLYTGVNFMIVSNIFWTLLLGLLSVILISKKKWYFVLLGLSLVFIAELLGLNYGGYGVLLIIIFSFFKDKWKILLLFVIANFIFVEYPIAYIIPFQTQFRSSMQWLSMIALIPIFLYNGKLGKFNKYFFYIYYPLHLGIILIIANFL
jgi:hypothetical protein